SEAGGMGTSIAATGVISWSWALLTLIAAVSLQTCTNIKNDLDDQQSGADDLNRTPILGLTGGSRVLQRGLATRPELLGSMLVFGTLSAAIGLYFALAGRPGVILFGLADLAVALAFGVGIVCGTAYVQTGTVPMMALAASIPTSILVALILFINGFQDAASDAEVTKRTAVVRLGLERASRIYPVIVGAATVSLVALVAIGALPWFGLLWLAG